MSFRGRKITEEARGEREKTASRLDSGSKRAGYGKKQPRKKNFFSGARYPDSKVSMEHAGRPHLGGQKNFQSRNIAAQDVLPVMQEENAGLVERATDLKEEVSLLPGLKPVLEYLETSPQNVDAVYLRAGKSGFAIQRILEMCRKSGIRFMFLDGAALERMYAGNHQGVIARLCAVPSIALEDVLKAVNSAPLPLILALDQVQDPGNLGTLARTFYAMGGAGIIVPRHNSAYIGNAAARSSAGALARLPVARVVNMSRALEQAETLGYTIYAAGKTATALDAFEASLRLPAVLVLGNEEQGIRPGVARRCSETIFIPMAREFDSLNVAQAGAILTACFSRAVRK